MNRPVVGVTIGDPAGIGPEIVLKAMLSDRVRAACRPVVIGDAGVLNRTMSMLGLSLRLAVVEGPRGVQGPGGVDGAAGTAGQPDGIPLIDMNNVPQGVEMGRPHPDAGRASFEFIKRAVHLASSGRVDALATAPISKTALNMAGINYIGHTEIISDLTQSTGVLTMFQVKNLRVFFLTRHLPLVEACSRVTASNVLAALVRCKECLEKIGIRDPRIAVAALNPHCGEAGLLGKEEEAEIGPAVEMARKRGVSAEGPIAADSVFHLASAGRFDAVLSMYHDQGHIAAKMLDFEGTVSVTLGLPFIRTSVDHGTAFDIAGKGVASAVSMEAAIIVAAEYATLLKSRGG